MRALTTGAMICVLGGVGLPAQSPEDRGREVALEAADRAAGFGDFRATLRMIVRNANGGERVRQLRIRTLEVAGEGERTIAVFDAPSDLRGTALLTVDYGDGSTDQWLYLPAMRRVKRIAGVTRSGSFMGSAFSYEDINAMDVSRYEHRLLGVDALDGVTVWVVERRPRDSSSQYGRQVVWFDRDEYRVRRIEFFDHHDALVKQLDLSDFERYGERFWRPRRMRMENVQRGDVTILEWSDFVFRTGLTVRDFEPGRLRHGG